MSSYYVWSNGRDIPLFSTVRDPASGVGLTLQTPEVAVQRVSDGLFWDGNLVTPGFGASPVFVVLTELDPVNMLGAYALNFPNSLIGAVEFYRAYYRITTGPASGHFEMEVHFSTDEVFVPVTASVSVVAGDSVLGRLEAMKDKTEEVPVAVAEAVDTQLTGTHGAGAWTGAGAGSEGGPTDPDGILP